MTLNINVCVGICLCFIGGMTWLLDQVARPLIATPSPLSVRSATDDAPAGAGALEAGPGFAVPSIVARAEVARREAQPRFAIAAPPEAVWGDAEPERLPPLVAAPLEASPIASSAGSAAGAGDERADWEIDMAGSEPREAWVRQASLDVAPVEASQPHDRPVVLAAAIGEPSSADAAADEIADPHEISHVVARGESLAKIARRYWDSSERPVLDVLVAANPQISARRNRLWVGETLVIPATPDLAAARALARSASLSGEQAGGARTVDVAAVGDSGSDGGGYYTIRERDSLSSIARRLLKDESRWPEIKRLNKLRNADHIRPGMRIRLPQVIRMARG